jgi:anti-anti-sigma factor
VGKRLAAYGSIFERMAEHPSLVIEFDFQGDLCVLRLRGRFLTGNGLEYLRTKTEELKNTGCKNAVADLKEVPYLDSTGIGFVVGLYTSLKNAGGRFVLANVNKRVRHVLEITRLAEIIPIFEDEPRALAAVRTG